ncbi:MAG TPA: tetratricopeptide repeat protein [Kofleriaceae bacterium]|nr:tetratricopeptide repeat protein [Kofleriaceae bacterium]
MRSRLPPHVFAVLAMCVASAGAQGPAPTQATAPAPDIDEPPVAAKAAPSDAKLSASAVPDYTAGPIKIAVTPFENHVPNGKSLEWVVAEAPFEIAEKAENILDLEAVNAPLYVPGERVPAESDTVADFAKKMGAKLVITGWYDRLGEQLRLVVLVWQADGANAKVVGEAQRIGAVGSYHKTLGDAMAEAFGEAGIPVDNARTERLSRTLSNDIYPVFMMGRGLGNFSGALAAMSSVFGTGAGSGSAATGPDLKAAEHDLERAVFLDPKLFEAQRLLGELYMQTAAGDPKLINKATGKFNYAADLAPDDAPSLRAAAFAMARAQKWEVALDLFRKLVTRRPWDLEARYQLGAALWQTGNAKAAERQLEQVTAKQPDHLPARRVLVLIHSAHNDTPRLIRELEAIAQRAPDDLDVKADLATAYGAMKQWPKMIGALEEIEKQRPNDLALLVRLGDAYRKHGTLDKALAAYQRAGHIDRDVSLPGFAAAQALFDANRLPEAIKAYQLLQNGSDRAAAEHALGTIAYLQGRADEAAWYMRQSARSAPRNLTMRRAVIAAELLRKDAPAARVQLDYALATWPHDGFLHYFSGVAYHLAGDDTQARTELTTALAETPGLPAATAALAALGARSPLAVDYKPELVRPWGDGDALQAAIESYAATSTAMARVRADYQNQVLALLGALGQGPKTTVKAGSVKTCPVTQVAKPWETAQKSLQKYAQLGAELETTYRFIARHDEVGMTASLLPNARTQVAGAKKSYRTALADMGELRSEWTRGLTPELRVVGCSDKLLQAALKDPMRYRVVQEDKPEITGAHQAPRPKPRVTFFVDNTRCADTVDVWIDGEHIGQVAPGRRSALVTDGGARTLCLLLPGGAQCGDRGTMRQAYLHDGWSTTLYCPK